MYPGKLFLYLNFMVVLNQLLLEKPQENEISQIIHESRLPQAINHASHAFRSGIHESRFNFYASRTNFSAHHASRIKPLPPLAWLTPQSQGHSKSCS